MYTHSQIQSLHLRLKTLFSGSQVWLGGSYLYGEAHETSDLDFYVISSFPWRIFWQRQHFAASIVALKNEFIISKLNIFVTPKIFFRLGWYYIYGQDDTGLIYKSKLNPKIIFRNCIKLAYFHYLALLRGGSDTEKTISFLKSIKQLTVAHIILFSHNPIEPLFSVKNILTQLASNQDPDWKKILTVLSKFNDNNSMEQISEYEIILGRLIRDVHQKGRHWLGFSLSNYIIYNLRFVLKGEMKFLRSNPDELILREVTKTINSSENIENAYNNIRQVIFPALII